MFSLVPMPRYSLLGDGSQVGHLVLLLFVPILVFAVYGIGRMLVATMPLLSGLSRQFFVEFSLATVVAASVYLLLRQRNEENGWLFVGLALGVACGLIVAF